MTTAASAEIAPSSRLGTRVPRFGLGLMLALWQRDLLRLRHDTGRWVGLVLQPVLLWVVLGTGMGKAFGPDYHRYFFPGLVVMVALFTTIFSTMAVIEDRQRGFLQQVLVAPGTKLAMVLGKVLGVTSIALLQLALVLPALPLAGFDLATIAWPSLLVVFVLGTALLTAASFTLAWLVSSTHAYHALMGVLLIPLWLVSGAVFPIPAGSWLGVVAVANPMTYMVDGLRHALDGGHAALAVTSPSVGMAVLAGTTFVMLALAARVARRPVGGPE